MRLNKKGSADVDNTLQKNLFIFAELAVSMIILIAAGSVAINKMQDAENMVLAKDVAFLIETISASPYKLYYSYPVNLETKTISIDEGSVTISSTKNTVTEKFMPMRGVSVPDSTIRNTVSVMFFFYENMLNIGEGGASSDEEYCNSLPIPNKEDLVFAVTYPSDSTEKYLEKIKETIVLSNKPEDNFFIGEKNNADFMIDLKFNENTDNNNLTIKYDLTKTGLSRIVCYLKSGFEGNQNFDEKEKINDAQQDKTLTLVLGSLDKLKEQMNQSEPIDPQVYIEMEKYGIVISDALKKGVKN